MHAIGSWIRSATGCAAALVVALAPTATAAQPNPRSRIDGSSAAGFEKSVVSLQNALPSRRREDFETALAVIWINNTVDSGDVDSDGDMDVDDVRRMEADADDLLTAIQRGNLVSAIEERAANGDDYTAAEYFKELDGLGYAEVLALAGRPNTEAYQAAERREWAQVMCNRPQSGVLSKWCIRFYDGPPVITPKTGRALNAAIQSLNAQNYAEARREVAGLNPGTLNPYERSMVEQVLFAVSEREGKPAEAREHLLEALAAGGLNPQEAYNVLDQLRVIDAQLSGSGP